MWDNYKRNVWEVGRWEKADTVFEISWVKSVED